MRGLLALWALALTGFSPRLGPPQNQLEDQRFDAGERVRVLLNYDHAPTASDVARVAAHGPVAHVWTGVVWAIAADLTRSEVQALLAADPSLVFAELSRPTGATAAFALRQVGWLGAVDPGAPGPTAAGGQVIAVLDAGFDPSHRDLAGKLVAWADFVGADVDRAGDEYANATDPDGHGTAVAGIAAGAGRGGDPLSFSRHGRFDARQGWCQDVPFPLSPVPGGRLVAQVRPAAANARYQLTVRRYLDGGRGLAAGNEVVASRDFVGNGRLEVDLAGRSGYGHYLCAFPQDAATAGSPVTLNAEVPWRSPDGLLLAPGAAPGARIVALKVGDDRGRGTSCTHLEAYEWLYQHGIEHGVSVANISRTANGGTTVLTEEAAVNNLVREKGIFLVTTPGNGWIQQPRLDRVGSPGSAKEAVTVGAVTPWDDRAAYSQPGHPTQSVRKPDLLAPGGTFRAPLALPDAHTAACPQPPCPPDADPFRDDTRGWDGTSFAAPLVAGVLAGLVDLDGGPRHTYAQVLHLRGLLQATATRIPGIQPGTPGDPLARNMEYFQGVGRINPAAAVDALRRTWAEDEVITAQLGPAVGEARVVARRIPLRAGETVVVRAEPRAGLSAEVVLIDAAIQETPTAPNRRQMACGGDDPPAPPPQAVAAEATVLARGRTPAAEAPCGCTCADESTAVRCAGPLDDAVAATHCPAACAEVGRPWAGTFACGPNGVPECGDRPCGCQCGPRPEVAVCIEAEGAGRCQAECAARGRRWTGELACGGCAPGSALVFTPVADGEAVVLLRRTAGAGVVEAIFSAGLPICDPVVRATAVGAPCWDAACGQVGRLFCQAGERATCEGPPCPDPDAGVPDAAVVDAEVDAAPVDAAAVPPDAAVPDAARPDAAPLDAAPLDATRPDAAASDAAALDAAAPDGARPDAAPRDAAALDAQADATPPDAAPGPDARPDPRPDAARPDPRPDARADAADGAATPASTEDGGCGCEGAGSGGTSAWLLALLALRRRRRGVASRPPPVVNP